MKGRGFPGKRLLVDLGPGGIRSRLSQLADREYDKGIFGRRSKWRFVGIEPIGPRYKSKRFQIIQQKALDYLKKRKANSVDIINSDYFLGSIHFERSPTGAEPQNLPKHLKEIKRVLKPNGRLYLTIEERFVPGVIRALGKEGFKNIRSKEVLFKVKEPLPGETLGIEHLVPEKGKTYSFDAKGIFFRSKMGFSFLQTVPVRLVAVKKA